MKQTLRYLAEKLGCRLLGDSSITVTSVSSLQSATAHSLIFVDDAQLAALKEQMEADGGLLEGRKMAPTFNQRALQQGFNFLLGALSDLVCWR